jgi:hypothetical protein
VSALEARQPDLHTDENSDLRDLAARVAVAQKPDRVLLRLALLPLAA